MQFGIQRLLFDFFRRLMQVFLKAPDFREQKLTAQHFVKMRKVFQAGCPITEAFRIIHLVSRILA